MRYFEDVEFLLESLHVSCPFMVFRVGHFLFQQFATVYAYFALSFLIPAVVPPSCNILCIKHGVN